MKIVIVPPNFVDYAWRDGADCLGEACEKSGGEITGSQLKMLISNGSRILARMDQDEKTVGWACGEILQKPNVRCFHITSLVCHNGRYQEAYDEVKAMAKSTGCSEVTWASSESVARLHRMTLKGETIEKLYSVYRMKL
jgi:hypothetical protein